MCSIDYHDRRHWMIDFAVNLHGQTYIDKDEDDDDDEEEVLRGQLMVGWFS